jgi:hypothetical protein
MDEAVGNLFTDCAVNVLDADGRAVASTGFGGLEVTVGAHLPEGSDEAAFTLEVIGAFALAQDMADWGFTLEEEYAFAEPVAGTASRAGGGALELYCGIPTDVRVEFADYWPEPPSGLHAYGAVRFRDRNLDDKLPGDEGGRLVLDVPIRLE